MARPPSVAWWGLLAGAAMLAISLTGLLWRIDGISMGLALLVAVVLALALVPRFGLFEPVRWRWGLLALSLLVIPTLAAFAPPHEWDEVAYGAALPRDYAQAGRFFYNEDYGPYSAFPANYEAITTASLVLTDSVAPARLFNVALALGLGAIAVVLSLRLGVPPRLAPLAAVLVLASPSLQTVLLIVKADVASAFFQALTLLAVVEFIARRSLPVLALAGFFLGTAVGTKYGSLQFALCVAPLVLLLVFRVEHTRRASFAAAAVFGVVALATALPWYWRNYAVLSNPFYPFFNEALGADNGFTALHSTLAREMFQGLKDYSWNAGSPGLFVRNMVGGFGRVAMLLSLPGLALALTRKRSVTSVFLVAVYGSFGLLTLFAGYWLPRYLLSLLVLASAFATLALAGAAEAVRLLPARPRAAAAAAVAFAALVAGTSLRAHVRSWELVADLYGSERSEFLSGRVRYLSAAEWINLNTPPGDRVGMGLNLKPFFYVERPYFNMSPLNPKGNLQARQTGDQLLEAFHALGLRWLVVEWWRPERRYPASNAPEAHAFARRFKEGILSLRRQGKIERVARLGSIRIFRVSAPAPTGGDP